MFNVRKNVGNGVWIEHECDKEVDAFKAIARIDEIFGNNTCGKCRTENAKFVCRLDKDHNEWLEMVCQNFNCRAKLVFSTVKGKEGLIYPKVRWNDLSEKQQEFRADEEKYAEEHNGWLPNGGWFIYRTKEK